MPEADSTDHKNFSEDIPAVQHDGQIGDVHVKDSVRNQVGSHTRMGPGSRLAHA